MKIGKALKLCRSARDLSLEVVAERAGISTSYLSRLENDKREPSLALIGKVAEALNIPVPVVVFLAAEPGELKGMDKQTEQRFADLALGLIRQQ
jgi:transcriptional regulator with XRE-family HTH domain